MVAGSRGLLQWRFRRGRGRKRQRQRKFAALAWIGRCSKVAAMCFGNSPRHKQALAQPTWINGLTERCFGLTTIELLKNMRQIFIGNAHAAVDYVQQYAVPFYVSNPNGDETAL